MAEWQKVTLTVPAAEELSAVQEALLAFVSKFIAINEDVILPALELIATIQQRQDVVATAAAAILDAAARLLDDFIKDAAGYLLVVNPLKPFGRAVAAPNFSLTDLGYLPVQQIIRAPSDTLIGDGGNYGMYRKIVESLYDEGDFSRPQMDEESWVGGFIMVFGSDTYLDLIQGLLQLQNIFGPTIPVPLDGFTLPVPQNLKAKPVTVSNRTTISGVPILDLARVGDDILIGTLSDSEVSQQANLLTRPPFGVRFKWDPEPLVTTKPAFGRFRYKIKKWTIYVKAGSRILPGEDITQYALASAPVLSTAVPVVDQVVTGTVYGAVIQGFLADETYYAAVAYTVEVEDREQGGVRVFGPTFESLSTQRRIRLEEQFPISQFLDGRPPDWIAISSPLAPFPQARQLLAEIRAGIDIVRDTFADVDNELTALIDYIRRRLQQIEDFIERLSTGFGLLDTLFAGFDVGIWVAPFQGRGGNPFFVKTMGDLLLDPNTENRPPFDRGDEVLASMVFLTESATVGAVQDFIAIGKLFTGSLETTGFTGSDINRVEREEPAAAPTTATAQQSLVDLGVTDEDPC